MIGLAKPICPAYSGSQERHFEIFNSIKRKLV
jgi:hypothetical protein